MKRPLEKKHHKSMINSPMNGSPMRNTLFERIYMNLDLMKKGKRKNRETLSHQFVKKRYERVIFILLESLIILLDIPINSRISSQI